MLVAFKKMTKGIQNALQINVKEQIQFTEVQTEIEYIEDWLDTYQGYINNLIVRMLERIDKYDEILIYYYLENDRLRWENIKIYEALGIENPNLIINNTQNQIKGFLKTFTKDISSLRLPTELE